VAALRAVAPGETPPRKRKPKTLLEAVASGDYLAELKATHERIARTVNSQETSPRDLAALTRRQLEISKEIRAIELDQEREGDAGSTPDETWDPEAL
jgi:hypothetical protein